MIAPLALARRPLLLAPLLKADHLAQNHIIPRERPASGSAGEVAALQAPCRREGGCLQFQQTGGLSRHRHRDHFGGCDVLPFRPCMVSVRVSDPNHRGNSDALSGEDAGPAAVPLPKRRVLNHLATCRAWPDQDPLMSPILPLAKLVKTAKLGCT